MAEITKEGFLLKQQLIEEAKKGRQEKQVRFVLQELTYLSKIVKMLCSRICSHQTQIIQLQVNVGKCKMPSLLQDKVTDMQENKKQLEEKVEALRTVKETAEQPEKEAKERHLKAWEGECSC